MKITQVDPIYCKVEPLADFKQISSLFEYESEYWQQGAYNKTRKSQKAHFAHHPHKGWFLAGLLPKVIQYCREENIEFELVPFEEKIKQVKPKLEGITFREDQVRLLNLIQKEKRGIIKSPTGSGKTILAAGTISQYPSARSMMVVHTQALFSQTIEELERFFGPIGKIGGGIFSPSEKITVCMIQTANSILKDITHASFKDITKLLMELDIIIVDEAHHIAQKQGHYAKLMNWCLAPIRIGFTATPLPKHKTLERLVGEGHLGPILGELSMEEGIEKGILAKPRLKLIPIPENKEISKYKKYQELYKHGIVLNKVRNRLIAKEAASQMKEGKSVLVMITDVVHGQAKIIKEMLETIYDETCSIVNGGTKKDLREEIKSELKLKNIKCVIVTSAWREGVNIPSLNCVINGIGGKSEIVVLQTMGRGLRTSEGKTEILLIDFLDPYLFLAQHSIERLRIYNDMGILNF